MRCPDPEGKYLDGEGGAIGSHVAAMDVVRRNALPKFTSCRPNLAVVAGDLRITPVGLPGLGRFVERELLVPDHDPDDPDDIHTYERLGGVLFVDQQIILGEELRYQVDFAANPNVLRSCALPPAVIDLFSLKREESHQGRAQWFARHCSSVRPASLGNEVRPQ
jgi:hypothetical protein